MKLARKPGSTSQTVYLLIQDSSSSTGAGLTGLVFNSAGLAGSYVRTRGTRTAVTLATLASAGAAYSSGGFVEVDATNLPGIYRFDIPDAALATGADSCVVMLKGATNMLPIAVEIDLDCQVDLQQWGGTAPNALIAGRVDANAAAGGDTSGVTTLLSRLSATRATNLDNLNATVSSRMASGAVVDANLIKILGSVVVEANAGQIAGGFNGFFDVTTPTSTMNLISEVSQVDLVQGDVTGSIAGSVGSLSAGALSGVEQAVWFSSLGPQIAAAGCSATGTATTIVLGTSPGADDCLVGMTLILKSGPGSPAARTITGYVASTLTATVDRPFLTAPTALTNYVIFGNVGPKLDASLQVTSGALATAAKTDVENAVWDATMASHTTAGTTGASLNAAGSAGDPLATAVPGSYAAGTVGYLIGHNLDAAVSSRSTYAGADTAGTTTLLARLTAGRATNLDNLDATVSSRLASTSYVTPPTTAQLATALWTDLLSGSDFATAGSIGKLLKDDVDAAISSRSTYAGGDTAGITTLLARLTAGRATNLDNLDATVSSRMATFALPANFAALGIGVTGNILNVDTINDARLAHLDADVSSRSTYAGADTAGTTTLLSRLTATRAGNLDNLDATISGLGSPMQAGTVTLAATQPNYAPAKAGDAMTLSPAERTSVATALLDLANGVETNVTLRQALRVLAADVGGKRSNVGTLNEQYDALGNPGTPRLVANLDGSGNGTPTITP